MVDGKGLRGKFGIAQQLIPKPILAIIGLLLGLVYIVILPFIGVAAFILASGYSAVQRLAYK